jgi:hypothetical protein
MSLSPTEKQTLLDAIERAMFSGATTITYEGKSITYKTTDDMMRLRAILRNDLGIAPRPATVLAQHSRGFRGGSTEGDDT